MDQQDHDKNLKACNRILAEQRIKALLKELKQRKKENVSYWENEKGENHDKKPLR